MEIIDKEKIIDISMKIILHSGDARTALLEAYDLLEDSKIEEAHQKMDLAKEELTKAHHYQTDIVQSEAAGIQIEYSSLFTHAQDTMMTTQAQYVLSQKIFKLYLKLVYKQEETL